MTRALRTLEALAVCAVVGASTLLAQAAATPPVKVNPSATKGKAGAPPPASAVKGTKIGKGKAAIDTTDSAGDTDLMWVDQVDIDGDGNVDQVQALWDDDDRVLIYAKDGTFACTNGGTGTGAMLVAVYAEGNVYNKPANSGWWVAEVDKDECKAQSAGLIGCKFDSNGTPTACGVAIIDNKTDSISFVGVKN